MGYHEDPGSVGSFRTLYTRGLWRYGGGILDNCLAIEKLAEGCIGIATSFAASGLGAYPVLLYGSEAVKQAYLPDIASGKRLAAFGLTESGAGSDVSGIQTTAVRDGDHYILNGTKQWITNGGEAEIYSILAITDRSKGPRGASFFVVEKGDPGFSFGKKEKSSASGLPPRGNSFSRIVAYPPTA